MDSDKDLCFFVNCSHCGNSMFSVDSKLKHEIVELHTENQRLQSELAKLKEVVETQKNLLANEINEQQFNDDQEVSSVNVVLGRLRGKGPFHLNPNNGKFHLESCIYYHPGSQGWVEIDEIELGKHRSGHCCTSPKALDLLEKGDKVGLRKFQENIGKESQAQPHRPTLEMAAEDLDWLI